MKLIETDQQIAEHARHQACQEFLTSCPHPQQQLSPIISCLLSIAPLAALGAFGSLWEPLSFGFSYYLFASGIRSIPNPPAPATPATPAMPGQVDRRTAHFWRTLPPGSFLEVNRRDWEELHHRLNGGVPVPKARLHKASRQSPVAHALRFASRCQPLCQLTSFQSHKPKRSCLAASAWHVLWLRASIICV